MWVGFPEPFKEELEIPVVEAAVFRYVFVVICKGYETVVFM
jgi:hypothetical protein